MHTYTHSNDEMYGDIFCSVESAKFSPLLLFMSDLVSMVTLIFPCHGLQAVDSRDSVAMALYSQCFSWIIMRINQKIKGKDNFKSIGILDIFGFENFEVKKEREQKVFSEKQPSHY